MPTKLCAYLNIQPRLPVDGILAPWRVIYLQAAVEPCCLDDSQIKGNTAHVVQARPLKGVEEVYRSWFRKVGQEG
jgi:hypothetical protein